MKRNALFVGGVVALQLAGCVGGDIDNQDLGGAGAAPSFEEFKAQTYKEPWEGGAYIVNGDTPVFGDKQLREFWASLYSGQALIVNTVGGGDDKWSDTRKVNLTYCVSNNFGSNKSAIVEALRQATDLGWETRGNVNFVYVSSEDGNCTTSNNNVLFNVRQVSGQSYLARAFFPSSSRSGREVLVDTSSFDPDLTWPLKNILGHELGHALGFRHEHTRPEAGTCFEDNNWRPLTTYDSASIMHYPQCNGTSSNLAFTAKDASGVSSLYGAPGGNPPPPPPPPPGGGKTETVSGSLAQGSWFNATAKNVKVGTTFKVVMTGTGDCDLYVRWNRAPTTGSYACRPYTDGSGETCELTVPSGATTAYYAIRGYTSCSYSATATWTEP